MRTRFIFLLLANVLEMTPSIRGGHSKAASSGFSWDEEMADVTLLQTSHDVFRAEVEAGGEVPVLSESDLFDVDLVNLLQTSSGVSSSRLDDSAVNASHPEPDQQSNSTSQHDIRKPMPVGLFGQVIPSPAGALQQRERSLSQELAQQSSQNASHGVENLSTSFQLAPVLPLSSSSASAGQAMQSLGVERSLLVCVLALIIVAIVLVILATAALIGVRLWALCRKQVRSLYSCWEQQSIRDFAETMLVTPGSEVTKKLEAGSSYDCAIMRPIASKQLLRLEARVEGAASGFCLRTPLTQQACVRFTATVCYHEERISQLPVQIVRHSSAIDFVVSLVGSPHVRLEIEGRDVSTFDMTTGCCNATRTFGSAAPHWQEFTSNHLANKTRSAKYCSEQSLLDFQETALVVGTTITVIGELQRNAVGTLLLQPWTEDLCENKRQEPWRTSWERSGCKAPRSSQSAFAKRQKPWLGKVWVSDDPALLRGTESEPGEAVSSFIEGLVTISEH